MHLPLDDWLVCRAPQIYSASNEIVTNVAHLVGCDTDSTGYPSHACDGHGQFSQQFGFCEDGETDATRRQARGWSRSAGTRRPSERSMHVAANFAIPASAWHTGTYCVYHCR
uniref:Uncharacterized protein n=1 Tax=Craspedostauros australis TaxID=1486917 RepID=A0A7R9WQG2_9STRA|mmetsp:Transcript_13501/g.37233  ORF Transcript_13501/g.37233 Transcript_13501/m.37233 type:complete len:112 (+) Transcript_13501:167-502(+)